MAPDVDSEFVLYEDDGCTNEYLKGAYLKTRIAVTAGVKTYVHLPTRAITIPLWKACIWI